MADLPKHVREQAEARFKRLAEQATESERNKAEYDADAEAVRKRTERLRAARLARDEAEKKPATDPPPRSRRGKSETRR
jgi:hypothetical protein